MKSILPVVAASSAFLYVAVATATGISEMVSALGYAAREVVSVFTPPQTPNHPARHAQLSPKQSAGPV